MTQVSNTPTEPPRPREPREEREPSTAGVVMLEQGRLFARLFTDNDEDTGARGSLSGARASSGVAMLEALAEQLAPRIQAAAQWPLQAVLYLPRLGRINASVRRERGA